jgi:xylan 1,4-beta-xylosidase
MYTLKHLLAIALLTIGLSSSAQQLVLPGDNPDPSVVKIGKEYWASATTSNWFPAFPLYKSKDLVHWTQKGYVFNQLPPWADYYFWAPEVTYDNGKVYVYYAAHKKGGNLCVGVASADKPEGPYKDHGPLVCQEDGSIDAFPMRDNDGKLYLVWKEDANSVGKPTPIWAQPMNEERTALTGEKKELFRNDQKWEGNLVEGVSMVRHGEYIYAFYAAAGCCGAGCTYQVGVARAKSLLGNWEKYNNNPILTNNESWICPGHGTVTERNGKYYFLHHGYDKKSNAFTGRQGLLTEFAFNNDGWITITNNAVNKNVDVKEIKEKFKGNKLSDEWEWSVFQEPKYTMHNKSLTLTSIPTASGAFVAQKTLWPDYLASTAVIPGSTTARAGLGAIGDDENMVSATVVGDTIKVIELRRNKETVMGQKVIPSKSKVYLQMLVKNGKDINFMYSVDGKNYQAVNDKVINGLFLPPWDRAVRVGLISKGESLRQATFDYFTMQRL